MPGESNSEKFIEVKLPEGESRRGYFIPYIYDVMSGLRVLPNKTELASNSISLYYFRLPEPGYYAFVEIVYKSTGSIEFTILPVIAKHGTLFSIDELEVAGTANDEKEIFTKAKNVLKEWRITLPQYAQRLEKENTSVLH